MPEGSRAISAEHGRPAAAARRHRARAARPLPAADRAAGRAAQLDQLDRRVHPRRLRASAMPRRASRRAAGARRGHADHGVLRQLPVLGHARQPASSCSWSRGSTVRSACAARCWSIPIIVALGYGMLALAPLLGGFIPIFTLIRLIKIAREQHRLLADEHDAAGAVPAGRPRRQVRRQDRDRHVLLALRRPDPGGRRLRRPQPAHWGRTAVRVCSTWCWRWSGSCWPWRSAAASAQGARERHQRGAGGGRPIPDLHLPPGQPFRHPVSPTAFRDADPGDVLHLRACRDDGQPLPRWCGSTRGSGVRRHGAVCTSQIKNCASPSSPATSTASRRAAPSSIRRADVRASTSRQRSRGLPRLAAAAPAGRRAAPASPCCRARRPASPSAAADRRVERLAGAVRSSAPGRGRPRLQVGGQALARCRTPGREPSRRRTIRRRRTTALGRAALVADQRVERVDELELRLERTPAAAAQRLALHVGLRHRTCRSRLQRAALPLHLALDGGRDDAEAEQPVEPVSRDFLAIAASLPATKHGGDLLAAVLDRDEQASGTAGPVTVTVPSSASQRRSRR